MSQKFSFMERVVGVFILLTFLSFLGSLVLVGQGQHWFKAYHTYYSIYKEGYNLQPGVKVKLLRTDIGHVTGVELTEDNRAKVSMSILAEYASRLTVDSKAAIESPTIIGSEFINIIPGIEKKIIEPGGQIPSKEAKELTAYLEEFDFDYKMKRLDEILENLAVLSYQIQDPQGPLIGTLENLRRLTESVNQGQGTLGRLVKGDELYDQVFAELEQLEKILATVQSLAGSLDESSASLKSGVRSANVVGQELEAKIPSIIAQVQNILKDLEKAMSDVPEISQRARRGMRDVNDILESVKKNILIRGNLPAKTGPESHGIELRGD